MLTVPDAAHAADVRMGLTVSTRSDWLDILRLAERKSWLSSDDASALIEALERWAPERAPSEFFYTYFKAVDGYQQRNGAAVAAAARTLGSILLAEAAMGRLTITSLPVQTVGDLLVLPGARPGRWGVAAPARGLADQYYLSRVQSELLSAIDEGWLDQDGPLPLRTATRPVIDELSKYTQQTLTISRLDPDLSVAAGEEEQAELLSKYGRAMALIEEIRPNQAAEIREVTEYVVPLTGDHFVGGSDITLYGATFLRLDPEWSELCFADHIIHEATHQLLHAHQEVEPLLVNRDHMGSHSPIRHDPRPLYGSFHATFVFLRLSQFMAAVLRSPRTDLHAEARLRFHRHMVGLLQGLKIIEDNGMFTERGRDEFDGWIAEARRLVEFGGLPEQELYDQVNWDYTAPTAPSPSTRFERHPRATGPRRDHRSPLTRQRRPFRVGRSRDERLRPTLSGSRRQRRVQCQDHPGKEQVGTL